MEHVETVIIGAGQAGLSTGVPPAAAGPRLRRPRPQPAHRRRLAAAVGQPAALLPRQVRRPAGDAVPGRSRGRSPARTRSPTTSRPTRSRFDLPVRLGVRVSRLAATGRRRRLSWSTPTRHARAATTSWWRPAPSGVRRTCPTSRRTSTRRSCSCTPASTAAPASSATAPSWSWARRHSGSDIAYEVGRDPADDAAGRDCGQIPVRLESRRMRVVFPVLLFVWRHVVTRRTPIGRKEMADIRFHGGRCCACKRVGPRRARRRAQRVARRGRARRAAGARRRHASSTSPTSCGRPASGRTSTGSTCRCSARTAGRGSTAASATTPPACSSAACRSSTRSRSMLVAGVRPRRGVRRPPDRRRAPSPGRAT